MWLIFCGACDNRPGGGKRQRKCERKWRKKKAPARMEHRKFNLLQWLFCCKGCCLWLSAVGSDARGHKKSVIKYSKRYSWKILLSYINYVCVVAIIFFPCLLAFYITRRQTCLHSFLPFIHIFIRRRRRRLRQFFHLVPKYKLE